MGVPDEAKPKVEFILGELVLERVEPITTMAGLWVTGLLIPTAAICRMRKNALVQNSEEEVSFEKCQKRNGISG